MINVLLAGLSMALSMFCYENERYFEFIVLAIIGTIIISLDKQIIGGKNGANN